MSPEEAMLLRIEDEPDCQLKCESCHQRSAFILCRRCAAAARMMGYKSDRRRNGRPIEEDIYILEGADIMEQDDP